MRVARVSTLQLRGITTYKHQQKVDQILIKGLLKRCKCYRYKYKTQSQVDSKDSVSMEILEEDQELQSNDKLNRLIASLDVQVPTEEVKQRINQIQAVLPDLGSKIYTMKPATLTQLIADPNLTTTKIIQLKFLFPTGNISIMASRSPEILLLDASELKKEVEIVKELMQMEDISSLIEREPRFLDSEGVEEALRELNRLLGNQVNIRDMLFKDPSYLLKVERGQKRLGENPDAI
eukprot:TRINITY_DN751_c0_g2_i1.p1 TRINITY_DN751_c0_g2~~TRINITY_DN751_c0_g2_i1.p1  ORF type:complete len:235 (-),score=28.48 TRINITY_DN751_c0_g2_i1:364-1068(-)